MHQSCNYLNPFSSEIQTGISMLSTHLAAYSLSDGPSCAGLTRVQRHHSSTSDMWSSRSDEDMASELPVIYKRAIVLFRHMYTQLRNMPCYQLFRRIKARLSRNVVGLDVGCAISSSAETSEQHIQSPFRMSLNAFISARAHARL